MAEKSGHTEKRTGLDGREYEVHYDENWHKTGETRFTTDSWTGQPKQEHFDTNYHKIGETKAGVDGWTGQSRAEHYDRDGKMIGTSRDETENLGMTYVQKHYDRSGKQVGSTHRETDLSGPKRVHTGEYYKTRGLRASKGPEPSVATSSTESSGYGGDYSVSYGSSSEDSTRKQRKMTFGVVFGRLSSLAAIAGLAIMMGFFENYRLNGPDEDLGRAVLYVAFGATILASLLERGFWFGFLAGGTLAVGSAYGLMLYPVRYGYMTPSGAIFSGLQFALVAAFVGWVAKKIAGGCNRSAWLSIILSWTLLGLLGWQLYSLSPSVPAFETVLKPLKEVTQQVEISNRQTSNPTFVREVDQQPEGLEIRATEFLTSTTKEIETVHTYTVVSGDSLWKISLRFYGDGTRWKEIAEANNLDNPSLIHTGNLLVIP